MTSCSSFSNAAAIAKEIRDADQQILQQRLRFGRVRPEELGVAADVADPVHARDAARSAAAPSTRL